MINDSIDEIFEERIVYSCCVELMLSRATAASDYLNDMYVVMIIDQGVVISPELTPR
jgi:hypothetical protein